MRVYVAYNSQLLIVGDVVLAYGGCSVNSLLAACLAEQR